MGHFHNLLSALLLLAGSMLAGQVAAFTLTASDNFTTQGTGDTIENNGGTGDWNGSYPAWDWVQNGSSGTRANTITIANVASSNRAQFDGVTAPNPYIMRGVGNLTGATSATLTFDLRGNGNLDSGGGGNDSFQVQASGNNGSSWTVLATYSGEQGTTGKSINISDTGLLTNQTLIRFGISAGTTGTNEFWYLDDVQITATVPDLLLSKPAPSLNDVDGSGNLSAGDILTYTITGTNNRTVTINNPVISDPLLSGTSTTCGATLASGATCQLTGTYTVQTSDVGNTISNTASFSATGQTTAQATYTTTTVLPRNTTVTTTPGTTVTNGNCSTFNLAIGTNLVITEVVFTTNITNGQRRDIDLELRNPGASIVVPIWNPNPAGGAGDNLPVQFDDDHPNLTGDTTTNWNTQQLSRPVGTLSSFDGTLSQGTWVAELCEGTSGTSSSTVNSLALTIFGDRYVPAPNITKASAVLANDADSSGDISAGDTLTWAITATNNAVGAEALTNVVITDDNADSVTGGNCGAMAISGVCNATANYVVQASDVTAGSISNTATVDSTESPAANSNTVVTNLPSPALSISKAFNSLVNDADANNYISAGDTIRYVLTVQATGTANLTGVTVSDSGASIVAGGTCPATPFSLNNGNSCTVFVERTVTAGEETAGSISNTATADSAQTSAVNSNTVAVGVGPGELSIIKEEASPFLKTDADSSGDVTAGDTVSYVITATNTGGGPLTNVTISDSLTLINTGGTSPCANLAAGATCTLTGDYVVTQGDVDIGSITNTGTVTSTEYPDGEQVTIESDLPLPLIDIDKTFEFWTDNGTAGINAGDTLRYTIVATATGTANQLNNLAISDPGLSTIINYTCDDDVDQVFLNGQSCLLTGTYTVTAQDISNGFVQNVATASSDEAPDSQDSVLLNLSGTDFQNVFYVPAPENDMFDSTVFVLNNTFCNNTPGQPAATNVTSYVTLSVLRDDTRIYVDHWEDQYEANARFPTQSSSQIWGDGEADNGTPPTCSLTTGVCTPCGTDACDTLDAGRVLVLTQFVGVNKHDATPPPNVTPIQYDGRDKFSTDQQLAITRAAWTDGPNTLMADSVEMFPTSEWGTAFTVPIGQNLTIGTNTAFEYTGAFIMASQNGTTVTVNYNNGGGTTDQTCNLSQGQSCLVNGGLQVGATVTSNNPVQVHVVGADRCDNYESRWYTLQPTDKWSDGYYNPVSTNTAAPTRVIFYNPNASAINVLAYEQNNTLVATISVPAGGTNFRVQTNGSGARYCTSNGGTPAACADDGAVFYAIAVIDADTTGGSDQIGYTSDWGYALLPDDILTQQALVGLGIGRDPTSPTNPNENGSPVWLTVDKVNGLDPDDGSLQVCVDYDNDGQDTPQVTPPGGGQSSGYTQGTYNGTPYDQRFTLNRLQQQRIYDPDGDQTGMFMFACDDDPDDQTYIVLSVAWGQEPGVATGGAPGVDMGTGIPNLAAFEVRKAGRLIVDNNGDGLPNIGDKIRYRLDITNTGFVSVTGLLAIDTMPPDVEYLPDTARINYGDGSGFQAIPDDAAPPANTEFPLDFTGENDPDDGYTLSTVLASGVTAIALFDVQVVSLEQNEICNQISVRRDPTNEIGFSETCLPKSQTVDYDYDDLPNSYGTTMTFTGETPNNDAPRHRIAAGLFLGSVMDSETNGEPGAAANSDTDNGVVFRSPLGGNRAEIYADVTVVGSGYLCAWLDVDEQNGFDITEPTVEQKCAGLVANQTVTFVWDQGLFTDGTHTTYARFRVCSTQNQCNTPLGTADNGEVEGYLVQYNFVPTAVTVGEFDASVTTAGDLLALLGRQRNPLYDELAEQPADAPVGLVHWDTLMEQGTMGFYVERQLAGGDWYRLNGGKLLPGLLDAPQGGEYLLLDPGVAPGTTVTYRLVEDEIWGTQKTYGPWTITLGEPSAPELDDDGAGWQTLETDGYLARKREPAAKAVAVVNPAARFADKRSLATLSAAADTFNAVRIHTRGEGLQAVPLADIAAMLGKSPTTLKSEIQSRRWNLVREGTSWHYRLQGNYLEFVAPGYGTAETDEDVFFLRPERLRGVTMWQLNGRHRNIGAPITEFRDHQVFEENPFLMTFVHNEVDADYMYWSFVRSQPNGSRTLTVTLPDPAPSGTARVNVVLRGARDSVENGLDHRIVLSVGADPGAQNEISWDGFGLVELSLDFNQAGLVKDANGNAALAVNFNGQALNGADYSMVLIDRIEVDYQRSMVADGGQLWIDDPLPNGHLVTVRGFAGADIDVIEWPAGPLPVVRKDVDIRQHVDGDWQVSFRTVLTGDYLVTETAAAPRLEGDYPASPMLDDEDQALDYLVIAPRALKSSAEALAAYRASSEGGGMRTQVTWLQDIYDQYSYGRVSSQAIMDYLGDAWDDWDEPPQYVVFLGRGTLDPRDLQGYGNNLIPVRLVPTPWGLYASDNLYADVTGDQVPEFSLGRIGATTVEEADAYLVKLIAYEGIEPPLPTWTSHSVVVADNPDDGGDFHDNSDIIASDLLAAGYTVDKLYHPLQSVAPNLLANWKAGNYAYVNYDGHGSITQLGAENFLNTGQVDGSFANGERLAVFAALTCSVGNNTFPDADGLSDELVLHPVGGSIAAYSPTGLSVDEGAHEMNRLFVQALVGQGMAIGDAAAWVLENVSLIPEMAFMRDMYHVAGCPAVMLHQ